MLDFSFTEFFNFVITVLGMVLSFLAGRISNDKTDNKK